MKYCTDPIFRSFSFFRKMPVTWLVMNVYDFKFLICKALTPKSLYGRQEHVVEENVYRIYVLFWKPDLPTLFAENFFSCVPFFLLARVIRSRRIRVPLPCARCSVTTNLEPRIINHHHLHISLIIKSKQTDPRRPNEYFFHTRFLIFGCSKVADQKVAELFVYKPQSSCTTTTNRSLSFGDHICPTAF